MMNRMFNKEIENCVQCPNAVTQNHRAKCNAKETRGKELYDLSKIPQWCPLDEVLPKGCGEITTFCGDWNYKCGSITGQGESVFYCKKCLRSMEIGE